MELTEQEQKFFDSGGQTEVTEETETTVETEVVTEQKQEIPPEKKKPSQFKYSEDTDNVVDDLGRKYVPLGAVQEARNENKTLKRELDDLKQKWTGGETKLNALLERLQGPKEELPAFDKDPVNHLKAKNDALESEIKAIKESQGTVEKEKETQNQLAEFQRDVIAAEKAFAAKNTDYGEAVAKVQEVWRAEYESAGMPDNFIETALARKGAQFTHAAMQKGQSPAEAVYNLAKRYGYAKKEEVENKDKEKLKTIAQGQDAAKSLSSGKGGGDMSLEALASMSDEEMDEFVKNPNNWKKLSKAS